MVRNRIANKLSLETIDKIRKLRKKGASYKEISKKTLVSLGTVNHYVVAWKNGFSNTTDYLDYLASKRGFRNHWEYQRERQNIISMRDNPYSFRWNGGTP